MKQWLVSTMVLGIVFWVAFPSRVNAQTGVVRPQSTGWMETVGETKYPRDGSFCWNWSLLRTSDFKFLQDIFGLFGGSFFAFSI